LTGYYFITLARRTAVFWLLVRIVMLVLALMAQLPVTLHPITGVLVVFLTVALIFFDTRLSGEQVFLENLGIGRGQILAVAAPVAGIFESIAQLLW